MELPSAEWKVLPLQRGSWLVSPMGSGGERLGGEALAVVPGGTERVIRWGKEVRMDRLVRFSVLVMSVPFRIIGLGLEDGFPSSTRGMALASLTGIGLLLLLVGVLTIDSMVVSGLCLTFGIVFFFIGLLSISRGGGSAEGRG